MAARESFHNPNEMTGRSAFPPATTSPSPPPPYPKGADSGEIRDDIRHTRGEMDETVDALAERLRPRHLLDDLLDVFRGGGGGGDGSAAQDVADRAKHLGSSALEKLKDHPVPAALIGAGIAWLIFDESGSDGRRRRSAPGRWRDDELTEHSGSFVDARTGRPYDESYGHASRQSGDAVGGGMMDKAREKAGQLASGVAGAASSIKDSVSGAASSATSRAEDLGRRASEWSGSAYGEAGRGLRRGYEHGRRGFEEALNEYPLATTAAALAAGVLTGLLLPGTRREDELMGDRAQELKEQVKQAGADLAHRGKVVAETTAAAAADEAQKQGLTPESLGEKAKHVAQDVAAAARESAHQESLDELPSKAKAVAQRGKEAAREEAQHQREQLKP